MAHRSLRRATVVGWSGRGSLEQLRSSVKRILEGAGTAAIVNTSGNTVIVRGPEPATVASILRHAPGAAWLAAGMASDTLGELRESAGVLGRRYVKRNSRFSTVAVGDAGVSASDVAGTIVSAVLDEVRGARVDEEGPQVVFRASLSKGGGAVGVEISSGPGGVPTGTKEATVLLSGGTHSSVLCWMALLSGYRLKMVHAKVDDESQLAVARLYAELSQRVDPSALGLEVLSGGEPASLVSWAVRRAHPPLFAGFHSGCSDGMGMTSRRPSSPLYLAQEEWFLSEASGLSLKPYASRLRWGKSAVDPAGVCSIGGVRGDVNSVLDGLLSRPRGLR